MLEWIENYREKRTHELNDASFEHDTQASSGATTGDWLVMLYVITLNFISQLKKLKFYNIFIFKLQI